MSKFIPVTSIVHANGGYQPSESLVNIDSIAILNKADGTHGINSEIRIHGGGTVRCSNDYESIKFLIGIEGAINGK